MQIKTWQTSNLKIKIQKLSSLLIIYRYKPALIVVFVSTLDSYRLLSGHPSLYGESLYINVNGSVNTLWPFGLKVHVDSVSLDRTGSTLYFGALTGTKLYSMPTSVILYCVNRIVESKSMFVPVDAADLEKRLLESIRLVYDDKPVSDGLSSDAHGNVW